MVDSAVNVMNKPEPASRKRKSAYTLDPAAEHYCRVCRGTFPADRMRLRGVCKRCRTLLDRESKLVRAGRQEKRRQLVSLLPASDTEFRKIFGELLRICDGPAGVAKLWFDTFHEAQARSKPRCSVTLLSIFARIVSLGTRGSDL
jgi:hypothetical protein